ncbi:Hypothetical predicted protein [Cloeon dipterum]|uniref:Eukaryotic translation initiation factor 5B n=1 Tax=Cloeon dipterum TaxID=197152 RepID=A0A8S1BUK0_9INSE|nr:Hypothetical predicted protein [Cloeon dipterum]
MVKAKRGKKAAKDGSDDSDIEVDDVADEAAKTAKSKAKKKPTAKPGFALLATEDDDMIEPSDNDKDDTPEEDEEQAKPVKNSKKGKKPKAEPEPAESEEEEVKPKAGKKGKKKKKKEDSDEELEKMLADLKMEYTGEGQPSAEAEAPKEMKKSKKPEPLKQEPKADGEVDGDAEEAGEGQSTIKSAAQKKREKREREKANKKAQKTKPDEKPDEQEQPAAEVTKEETKDEAECDGNKKKGKKGAAEPKEEKKPNKKNKMIEALKEAQRKQEEEEKLLEKLREEEEKRLQAEEEARLEAEKKEQERKEKKKQKEKERRDRLKAEGKLLTPKQKQDKARAEEMLRSRGLVTPGPNDKKTPRPGTRIRPNKKNQQQQQENAGESKESSPSEQQATDVEQSNAPAKEEEEVKESWDAESDHENDNTAAKHKHTKKRVEEAKVVTAVPELEVKKEAPPAPAQPEEGSSEEEEETDSNSASESESDEKGHKNDTDKKQKALARIEKRKAEAEKNRSVSNLRAAVICVLGHVDTGKTKILDKLRRTSVQAGEAGGITQQIGATNVPIENIKEQTKIVRGISQTEFRIPGLLIIDTPGHASFSNLRSRGSSLCDMAILVVDIMHGLEEQTIESLNLLKAKKTPFVVALNKIDRLYDWSTMSRKDVRDIISSQGPNTQNEFQTRTKQVILQFAEQGMNAALFYENPDPKTYVSLVPTSAITGEGMGNLLALLVTNCQSMLAKRLMFSEELQATVLEVKAITGLGTTIDCILVNGRLREGDTVVMATSDGGSIVTQIRSLLMPQPMKELRVKNDYIEHKEVVAAQGVKIAAKDLEKVIAGKILSVESGGVVCSGQPIISGLNILVARSPDEVEICKEEVVKDLARELGRIKLQDRGVLVQASTLGSLEALLEFLKDSKIPYSSVKIGPVVKRDVMKASSMLERENQYGTILAFDVKVERDAQELADQLGVKIFQADIIYHLFDQFTAHREQLKQQLRQQNKHVAVFPCKLRILPQYVFNSRDPIVMGVIVEDGIVCVGTPICVQSKEDPSQFLDLGIVSSIESNHKSVETARRGLEVCIKIENAGDSAPKMFGRHFDEKDMLLSKVRQFVLCQHCLFFTKDRKSNKA